MARQTLNAEHCLRVVAPLKRDIEWLLHIDSDEVFIHWRRPHDTTGIFHVLSAAGAERASFVNHEVLPERADYPDGPFTEATLFQLNPLAAETKPGALVPRRHQAAIKRLRSRARGATQEGGRFLAYMNGKGAARVGADVLPDSVHGFGGKGERINVPAEDACILHYANCGSANFADKYKCLGEFKDLWFGKHPIRDLAPFHLTARDAHSSGGLEQLYRERVVISPEEALELGDSGCCLRILAVRQLLSGKTPDPLPTRLQGSVHGCDPPPGSSLVLGRTRVPTTGEREGETWVGATVEAHWEAGLGHSAGWYRGKVRGENEDGSLDIDWADGTRTERYRDTSGTLRRVETEGVYGRCLRK
eukprot:Hpha_TRINITY_DN18494_c0_g1::TRINITY_DN18494_c0_g1_i1::g.165480::m.165480